MSKDYIAEHIGWLDSILTHPENPHLFQDDHLAVIQKELANRWIDENRLELLNDLADRFGEEDVLAVIDQIISTNCRRDWELVGKEKGNSFAQFLKILWEPLRESGFEYSYETEGNKTTFCVTKCAMYDLARKIGAEKWLYHLVCLTDEPSIVGFNNKIEFRRTRTLMQGYPDCDHCYTDLSYK
ncbi:hypothetical protein U27_06143 [Candidatus Vecturithrix granuli]|uniref:L-2-amino-thiazoline-4-carboxylic acid hydrolase n=1 Tax=Vecturithrix granuli TaxID=1499967 RepID=A0A081C3L2_VECG1|nr:hypothetical protein U27_06143 [Candidatus Vecturithrix granuli]